METISYPKEVKAIKDHVCDFCCDKIKKDEKYNISTHTQDGSIYSWKTHLHCDAIASRLEMYKDLDGEGLTGDMFHETIHCVHTFYFLSILA